LAFIFDAEIVQNHAQVFLQPFNFRLIRFDLLPQLQHLVFPFFPLGRYRRRRRTFLRLGGGLNLLDHFFGRLRRFSFQISSFDFSNDVDGVVDLFDGPIGKDDRVFPSLRRDSSTTFLPRGRVIELTPLRRIGESDAASPPRDARANVDIIGAVRTVG